jgi:hypothetical protein
MVRHVKIPTGWLYQVVICPVGLETEVSAGGNVRGSMEVRSMHWSEPVFVLAPPER